MGSSMVLGWLGCQTSPVQWDCSATYMVVEHLFVSSSFIMHKLPLLHSSVSSFLSGDFFFFFMLVGGLEG